MEYNKGIRIAEVERNEDGSGTVDVTFGPHHRLLIESDGKKTTFTLVTTHHGIQMDASEVNGELEKAIYALRERFPGTTVD